jgi:hypothetical protein
VRAKIPLAALAALAIGVVIGFVLGGIGPRRELASSEQQVQRLARELEESGGEGGAWRSPVPGLDRILRDPAAEEEGVPLPAAEEGQEATPSEAGEIAEVAPGLDGGVEPLRVRERWDRDPEERFEAFQRAASIQRVRAVQSRAALVEQAGLDDAEQAQVDDALRELNEEIRGHGEALLYLALADQAPPARDLLGVTHDVTGILHRAQLRLEEIVGPERMTSVDPSALEIWNHVDLTALEPAARAAIERR